MGARPSFALWRPAEALWKGARVMAMRSSPDAGRSMRVPGWMARLPSRRRALAQEPRDAQVDTPLLRAWLALARGYLAAVVGVVVVSLVIAGIQRFVHFDNISLLYLLAVLWLAAAYGRGPAIFASLLAFLAYDFFFIPPLYRFTVDNPAEYISLLALLATSLVAGQLTAAVRARAREARASEQRTATLYALAQLINSPTDEATLLGALAERVVHVFAAAGVQACAIITPDDEGQASHPITRALYPPDAPLAASLRLTTSHDAAQAIWALSHGATVGGVVGPATLAAGATPRASRPHADGQPSQPMPFGAVVAYYAPLRSGARVVGALGVVGAPAVRRMVMGAESYAITTRGSHGAIERAPQRRPGARVGKRAPKRGRLATRALRQFLGGALPIGVATAGGTSAAGDGQRDAEHALFVGVCDQIALALERRTLAREAIHVAALRESDRLKNALLGAVTHDLRTPLATIRVATESLLEPDVTWDDEQRHYFLETIDTSAQRLSHMVTNLLDLSRLEAGVAVPRKQWYPIGDVTGATLDRLDLIGLTAGRPIELDVPTDLPLVPLDHEQIEQVITNLIENAIKYSPEGSPISVEARVVAPTRADEVSELEVRVIDHGEGIPAKELTAIFDQFYRVKRGPSLAPAPRGAGLGLAICAAIIQAHGGRIWAESELGAGSTFIFRLPIPPNPANDAGHMLPEAEAEVAPESAPAGVDTDAVDVGAGE